MSLYSVATGSNVALVSLTLITPQPRSEGQKPTQRSYAADGTVYNLGNYVELEWQLVGNVTAYQALLTLFGIRTVLSAAVTVYIRDSAFAWARMNGTAVRPEPGRDVTWAIFPRNIKIIVKDLETAS